MDPIEERKQAIQMYYQGYTKTAICRQLRRSRPWLDRWLSRYNPDQVRTSIQDRRSQSEAKQSHWSGEIKEQVIQMRRERMNRSHNPYQLIGAAAIHYELAALEAPEVPPIRTIHHWLKEAGLISNQQPRAKRAESLPIPVPQATTLNQVHQLDLKGPLYLTGSADKHYLIVVRDLYSRRCALTAVRSKEAEGIVKHLVATWQQALGVPHSLQMDNALEFRGSNRYPRSFGKVVRLAVALGVEAVFNPVGEPWRNGCVERFNQFLDKRLLSVTFNSFEHLLDEVHRCQQFCNQYHRLASLEGRTPTEVANSHSISFLDLDYERHLKGDLSADKGSVSFIRLVRKSGRITLGANDRFMVDPDLAYTYVLARVNLLHKRVTISQNEQDIVTYDFSKDTIGAWADGINSIASGNEV